MALAIVVVNFQVLRLPFVSNKRAVPYTDQGVAVD